MQVVHYCQLHRSKFYRNEKQVNGDAKVWYSHKILDGQGFCVEKETSETKPAVGQSIFTDRIVSPSKYMFMCNAMNNAVALAAGGKIELDQIGSYYKRILTELTQTA
ncbi:MAG: hypothetical protein M1142_03595 [Patescibacteria group bacterium]|nr:hypothetical protein [Patescibacteria group bacterium]